jgi:hypothetical protein
MQESNKGLLSSKKNCNVYKRISILKAALCLDTAAIEASVASENKFLYACVEGIHRL